MTREEMSKVMDAVFSECKALRQEGQKEYAHREDNAFANFERVAERLGISREAVLMVYAEKHIDGIHSYIQGHRSQRESVKGRINDVIVYMCLLRGMVGEGAQPPTPAPRCVRGERHGAPNCGQPCFDKTRKCANCEAGMHHYCGSVETCPCHCNEQIPRTSPPTPYSPSCALKVHAECVAVECGCACHGGHTTTCKCLDCRQRKGAL